MRRCLQLASLGRGQVSPNPCVGALLVHNGQIIGEGYHQQYGGPHAEVHCIRSVRPEHRQLISSSTLYVSLEPCNHFGKTPPCTNLIIEQGIPRVVVATRDPFPQVDGRGIDRLRASGVEVIEAVLEKEAQDLNIRFFTFHTRQRPYVILKWAQSADGKIAAAGSRPVKISHELTDRLVHKWRSEESAIMVGSRTAISDNPSLTTRLWPGKNPVRVVADTHLVVPSTNHLLDQQVKTIIFNSQKDGEEGMLHYKFLEQKDMTPNHFLQCLYHENLSSVIIEGGSKLLQSFIDAGHWDETRVITNTHMTIPGGRDATRLQNCRISDQEISGTDRIMYYKPILQ